MRLMFSRQSVIIVVALSLLVSGLRGTPVFAGEGATTGDAEKEADPKLEEAIEHFQKGVAFFDEENVGAALVEFLKSYELAPTWKLLYNIGICYKKVGKLVKGLETLQEYLKVGGKDVPEDRRQQVEEIIKELEGKIGFLMVECSEKEAKIELDEFVTYMSPLDEPIQLTSGIHKLVVSKAGFETFKQEVTVASEESKVLKVALKPLPAATVVGGGGAAKPKKPLRWLWAALGSGLGLGVGAAISGGLALKYRGEMNDEADRCPSTMTRDDCPKAYDARDSARRAALGADILMGCAIGFAAVGLILFAVDRPKPAGEKPVDKKKGGKKDDEGKGKKASHLIFYPILGSVDAPILGAGLTLSF
jgi:hypothetical protein